jgi:hypothetical protein
MSPTLRQLRLLDRIETRVVMAAGALVAAASFYNHTSGFAQSRSPERVRHEVLHPSVDMPRQTALFVASGCANIPGHRRQLAQTTLGNVKDRNLVGRRNVVARSEDD